MLTPIEIILNGLRESFDYDQNEEELLKEKDKERKNPSTFVSRKSHPQIVRELLENERR